MSDAILEVKGLTKHFGGVTAVLDVDLSLRPDGIHAIIGPNGAGKTTLFHMLAGTLRPSEGTIKFLGRDVTSVSEPVRARLGLVRSFQQTSIFGRLTVLENVLVSVANARNLPMFGLFGPPRGFRAAKARAREVLELVGLDEFADLQAQSLPYGSQRSLDLAIALGRDPKLLLLDEPTSGLSAGEADHTGELIRDLSKERAILLIEHNVDLVLSLANRMTVLNFGQVLAHGTPEEVSSNSQVQEAYFGAVTA